MKKTLLGMLMAGMGLAIAATPAMAEHEAGHEASRKASIPTFGEVLDATGIEIGGYIDTSYTYSNNGMPVEYRAFDTNPSDFNVQMLELSISKQPEKGFGGVIVLNAGQDANVISADGSTGDFFDVQQAFVSYKAGGAHLMFGKFATLIGAEVIESPNNLNFSRSILFFNAIPFTHTGVRLHYETGGSFAFSLGVNNGWDNVPDNNKQKSAEWAVSFAPSDKIYISVQGIVGSEPTGAGNDALRNLIDVVAQWQITNALSLMLNYDYGTQKEATGIATAKAKWSGLALYANYDFSETWRATVRWEYFKDDNGFKTGIAQKLNEATLTVAYMPMESVEIRGEARRDWSDVKTSFAKSSGISTKSVVTAALEAIYKY